MSEAQGLTLLTADNQTGFACVYRNSANKTNPYQAQVRRNGKLVSLGSFATAKEAALRVAQSAEGQAAAAKRAAAAVPLTSEEVQQQACGGGGASVRRRKRQRAEAGQAAEKPPAKRAAAAVPLTSEDVQQQVQTEGLTLLEAEGETGYFHVYLKSDSKSNPFVAQVLRSGKRVSLGRFASAAEAALCYARSEEGQAEAARRAAEKPAKRQRAEMAAEASRRGAFCSSVVEVDFGDDLRAALVEECAQGEPAGGEGRSSPPTEAEYKAAPGQAAALFNYMRLPAFLAREPAQPRLDSTLFDVDRDSEAPLWSILTTFAALL